MSTRACNIWASRLLAGQLLIHVVAAVILSRPTDAQSQDVINERQANAITAMEVRMTRVEMDTRELPTKVALLETTSVETKWLSRGVTVAVFGQLVLNMISKRKTDA